MEEPKVENFEIEAKTVGTDDGGMIGQVPTGAMPAPQAPAPTPMQMQPIDLSTQMSSDAAQPGMVQMTAAPQGSGKNKTLIIIGVVIAGLIVGGIGFFVWNMMQKPATVPVVEQTPSAPTELPPVTKPIETVVVPPQPQPDDISVIEQSLNTFNVNSVDTELNTNLSGINAAL